MNAHTSQPPPPQAAAAILNPTKRNKHARLPGGKIELSTRGFREPFATRSEQKPVVKTLAFEIKLAEKNTYCYGNCGRHMGRGTTPERDPGTRSHLPVVIANRCAVPGSVRSVVLLVSVLVDILAVAVHLVVLIGHFAFLTFSSENYTSAGCLAG